LHLDEIVWVCRVARTFDWSPSRVDHVKPYIAGQVIIRIDTFKMKNGTLRLIHPAGPDLHHVERNAVASSNLSFGSSSLYESINFRKVSRKVKKKRKKRKNLNVREDELKGRL
jgi:hypothetical protein